MASFTVLLAIAWACYGVVCAFGIWLLVTGLRTSTDRGLSASVLVVVGLMVIASAVTSVVVTITPFL